ncbi:Protein csh3 [Cryptotrichosporon argae]
MSFATNIVIGSCAFLLGMVFVCQVVDIPLLYMPVTDAALENAYRFYAMWFESPGAVKALFHVALAVPLFTILIKLQRWTESAVFFDGSSAALQLATIILYITVHISSLRTALPDSAAAQTWSFLPAPPARDAPPTADERVEAVRVLAAGNALCGLLLLAVIGMQVGQEYAGRMEEKEQMRIDEAAKKVGGESKKDI